MSVLWVVPLVVLAIGGFFLARAVQGTADEAEGLASDAAAMDELRHSLAELRQSLAVRQRLRHADDHPDR